jgi:hypothetical protein
MVDMTTDRTERTRRTGTVAGVGLLGSRRLITHAPGSGGPVSLVLGALLVAVAVVVFVGGFPSGRTTLGFGAEVLVERWSSAVEATDRQRLRLPLPSMVAEGAPPELVFTQRWSETLALRGRADPDTLMLVELSVTGHPAEDDPALIAAAMDLLVAVSEPELDPAGRLLLLRELGIVDGGAGALRATRGSVEYRYAVDATGAVGMSAAPA